MTEYARVSNGVVAQTFTPPSGFTLAECFTAEIAAQFVAVPSGVPVGEGWAYTGGTFAPPGEPTLTPTQQAQVLIAAGLTVTSTGTPSLDGVYIVADGVPFGRQDIANEAQFVSTFGEFTNGGTTLAWPLLSGAMVTFPSTAEFMAFAKAVAQFRAAILAAVATNGTLPSNTTTIA